MGNIKIKIGDKELKSVSSVIYDDKKPLPKKWINIKDELPEWGEKVCIRGKSPRSFGYGMKSKSEIINLYDTFEATHWAYEIRV